MQQVQQGKVGEENGKVDEENEQVPEKVHYETDDGIGVSSGSIRLWLEVICADILTLVEAIFT